MLASKDVSVGSRAGCALGSSGMEPMFIAALFFRESQGHLNAPPLRDPAKFEVAVPSADFRETMHLTNVTKISSIMVIDPDP
eukprot:COSAG02_NODE_953_length_15689_cov_112.180564_10_plen_82_part_00